MVERILRDDAPRAFGAVVAVLALHHPYDRGSGPQCKGCATHVTFTSWPCATVKAVYAALGTDVPDADGFPRPDETWCPRCMKDATEDRYTQESASLWRCLDCHAVLVAPDPPVEPYPS